MRDHTASPAPSFRQLADHGLIVNAIKCTVDVDGVNFLGHWLSCHSVGRWTIGRKSGGSTPVSTTT